MAISRLLEEVEEAVKRDDIRGVYNRNIDRDFARQLGLALAEPYRKSTAVPPVNVVVGHDMRLSGPVLAEGLCTGLEDGGCRALRMGRAGTELVGFLPAKYPEVIDGGVIITASHNPKDNNGFKFFARGGMPLTMAGESEPPCPENELQRVALGIKKRRLPRQLPWEEFAPDYIETAVRRGGLDFEEALAGAGTPLRVAVEAGNGMGGRILGEFARITPQFQWRFAHQVPDGNFPVIIPNPLQEEYQRMLTELVRSSDSHIGLCFDGDADRVAVCDENGRMLPPPDLTALVGRRLRQKLGPQVKVAFNLATSWVVPDTLGEREQVLGGSGALMTPVGYGKIKPIMYDNPEIALGAEHSGHYMFREFWCSDSGMLAGLMVLELTAELHSRGEVLSGELQDFRSRYFESGEINFQLPPDVPGDRKIAEATEQFADQIERMYVVVEDRCRMVDSYPPEGLELSVSDVRAESGDWWFCMRKSGTEAAAGDVLRLYVEADGDEELMQDKRDALVQMVGPEYRM